MKMDPNISPKPITIVAVKAFSFYSSWLLSFMVLAISGIKMPVTRAEFIALQIIIGKRYNIRNEIIKFNVSIMSYFQSDTTISEIFEVKNEGFRIYKSSLSFSILGLIGFPKLKKSKLPPIAMKANRINRVDCLVPLLIIKVATTLPIIFEPIKKAQKRLLKKPLFSSVAHSDRYFP